MRLVLLCVGRSSGAERDLWQRYIERANAAGRVGFANVELRELDEAARVGLLIANPTKRKRFWPR